jgi:hypothetical protein
MDRATHYLRKHLWQPITKAIKRFGLIGDGDRIGVGLSGGVDSAVLLFALSSLRKRAPVAFEVIGLHVDVGMLETLCGLTGVELHTAQAPIAKALEARSAKTSPSRYAHIFAAAPSTPLQSPRDAARPLSVTIPTTLSRRSRSA